MVTVRCKMIKRNLIPLMALILIFGIHRNLQAENHENAISINPVGITLLGMQNVEYERALTNKIGMAIFWAMSGKARAAIGDITIDGSEQRVTLRCYAGKEALSKHWLGASIAFSTSDLRKGQDYVLNISMLALSIEAGYRFTAGHFNLAPIIMFRMPITSSLLGPRQTSGIDVKIPFAAMGLGINLGWGW
jgi:hypothetical protein